jgi:hypothetical protein
VKQTAVADIVDRLYGLPLPEFTGARNAAASELRKAGRREAADQVKALRKPTAAAAAVNRLVRKHRSEVEQFLRAAAVLRDAQFSRKGDLAAAAKEEHEELERLTHIGGETVRQTLLAAAVDDEAAQQLLEARLERELEPRGFGTLIAYAPPAAARPVRATAPQAAPTEATAAQPEPAAAPASPDGPETKKPDDGAARARLHETKEALSAAEAEERQARRHWDQTHAELEKARTAVDKARRELDRLHRD